MTNKNRRLQKQKQAQQRQLIWLAVAALVVILGGIWFASRNMAAAPLPPEISVAEAYEKYEEGVFVLDVRTQEEWDEYHAPNTSLIPLDQLASRLDELPRDQEIVVICRSGNRSAQGRDILLDAGFPQVTSVAGGLVGWGAAGYPVVGN